MEKYNHVEAEEEAFKLKDMVETGLVGDYAEAERKMEKTTFLNEKELVTVVKGLFALRHVSSNERAKKEKAEGIELGDALALSSIEGLFSEEEKETICGRLAQFEGRSFDSFLRYSVDLIVSVMTEAEKNELLEKYSKAVKLFLSQSVGSDINHLYDDGMKTADLLEILKEKTPSFLVLTSDDALSSYDQDNYYGLGKLGRQSFSTESIKNVVNLSQDDWKGLEQYRELPLNQSSFELLVELLAEIMIKKLKQALSSKLV